MLEFYPIDKSQLSKCITDELHYNNEATL